jgi:hypothetical protein
MQVVKMWNVAVPEGWGAQALGRGLHCALERCGSGRDRGLEARI